MSRRLLTLFPRERREWGEAYLAEFPDGEGLWRVLIYSWFSTIKGGNAMKTVVVTASIVNAMFGMFVVGLFLFTSDNPGLVLVLGLSLIAQGGYTLWYISKRNDSTETWATKLLLGGQTVALLVGLGGFSVSTISQLTMNVDHPEYGPMAVAGLIAFQATATLYLFAVRGGAVRITSPNGT